MKKRSQSALEFLITYGWAILLVISMIVALSYFGVLDLSRFLPSTCMSSLSVAPCMDKPVTNKANNELYFLMGNEMGYRLDLDNATTTKPYGCTDVRFCDKDNRTNCDKTRAIPHHTEFIVKANCTMTSTRYTGTFVFNYVNSISSLPESFQVRVSTKVR